MSLGKKYVTGEVTSSKELQSYLSREGSMNDHGCTSEG